MDFFSRLCGFEAAALALISEPRDRFHLGLSSLFSLSGVFLSALSTVYLFWECTESWLVTVVGFFLILLALYAILVIFIVSSALPIFKSTPNISEVLIRNNGPRWTRLIIFLLISLSFTQPIAVFIVGNIPYFENQIQRKIKINAAITARLAIDKMDNLLSQREQDLTRLSEMYDRLLVMQYTNSGGGVPATKDVNNTNRKALVFGNANYLERPLQNPTKDARDLAAALEKMGFKTKIILDADRLKMEREIDSYAASLTPKDISIFFFSGHGFQEEGNFLIPIGMRTENRSEAIGLNITLEKIKARHPRANILIIDACRDFPFGTMKRGGLGDLNLGPNTYLALAASPGQSAADGPSNTNGLFTSAILHNISKSVDIDLVFRSVREEVYRISAGRQLPWTSSTLGHELILKAPFNSHVALSEGVFQTALTDKVSSFKGLSIDPDLPVIPNSFHCGIVGDPEVDEGVRKRLLNCLGKQILRAQDDYKKFSMDIELFKKNENTFNVTNPATRFISTYKILWSDTLFVIGSASLTIILLILLTIGHIMREGFPSALIQYEYSRQYLDKEHINSEYAVYLQIWRKLIDQFRTKFGIDPMVKKEGILNEYPPLTALQDYLQTQLKKEDETKYQDFDALLRAIKINSDSKL